MAESGEGPLRGGNPDTGAWNMDPEAENSNAEEAEKKERERLMAEINQSFGIDIINIGTKIGLKIENTQDLKKIESNDDLRKLADALKADREAAEKAAAAAKEGKTEAEAPADKKTEEAGEPEKTDEGEKAVVGGVALIDRMKEVSEDYANSKKEGDPETTTEEAETKEAEESKETEKSKKRGRGLMAFFGRHPKLKKILLGTTLAALGFGLFVGGGEYQKAHTANAWENVPVATGETDGTELDYTAETLGSYDVDYRGAFADETGMHYNTEKNAPFNYNDDNVLESLADDDSEGARAEMVDAYLTQPEMAASLFSLFPEDFQGIDELKGKSATEISDIVEKNPELYDQMMERVKMFVNNANFQRTHHTGDFKTFYARSSASADEQISYENTELCQDTVHHEDAPVWVGSLNDKDGDSLFKIYFDEWCGNQAGVPVEPGVTPPAFVGVPEVPVVPPSTPETPPTTPETPPTTPETPPATPETPPTTPETPPTTPETPPTTPETPETPPTTPETPETPPTTPETPETPPTTPETPPTTPETPPDELKEKNKDAEIGHSNGAENDILGPGDVTEPTTPTAPFDTETGNFGGIRPDDPVDQIPDELLDENGNYQAPSEIHIAIDPNDIVHEDGTTAADTLAGHEQNGGADGTNTGGDTNTGAVAPVGEGETIFDDDNTGVTPEDIQEAKDKEPEQKATQEAADEALAPSQEENRDKTAAVESEVDTMVSGGATEEEARTIIDERDNQETDANDFNNTDAFALENPEFNTDVDPYIYDGGGDNGGGEGQN